MNEKAKAVAPILGLLVSLLMTDAEGNGQRVPFVEPDDGRGPLLDGRAPLLGGINQGKFVDMYIFKICEKDAAGTVICDDEIINSIRTAAGRPDGSVRVLLEPCPGLGFAECNRGDAPAPEAVTACNRLTTPLLAGLKVKWANPGFRSLTPPVCPTPDDPNSLCIRKTHAKSVLIDDGMDKKAFILTANLVPSSFDQMTGIRRDYGVLTNDLRVIENLGRVFAQDWGTDETTSCLQPQSMRTGDSRSQIYDTLVISPDRFVQADGTTRSFARDKILGLIRSATTSLKIHIEKIDPANPDPTAGCRDSDPEILAALEQKALELGPNFRVLLTDSLVEPCNALVADAVNLIAPGQAEARFQTMLSMPGGLREGRPHAKIILVDAGIMGRQQVYVGSHNLTNNSLDIRREIGWITGDPGTVMTFQQKFDADWDANSPPPQ